MLQSLQCSKHCRESEPLTRTPQILVKHDSISSPKKHTSRCTIF
uniref:Uncharacterized protein n=1 Tax=Arundo donax TaxID=35708 RepID=A0A0A9ASP7_ARUDO